MPSSSGTVRGSMGPKLARVAREALATTRCAELLVADLGPVGCEVSLHERDGVPMFWCEPDSQLARSVGRPTELHIQLGSARHGGTVELIGRLVRAGGERCDGVTLDRLELDIDSIVVQRSRRDARRSVPVATYLSCVVDDTMSDYVPA